MKHRTSMKLMRNCNHLIWILVILASVAAQISLDDKKTTTSDLSNDNVLSLILNKLNRIDEEINIKDRKTQQDLAETKAQLNNLQNSIQTIISKVADLENVVRNNEQNQPTYQCDLAKQRLTTEFQNLQNSTDSFNPTLNSIGVAWASSSTSCAKALQTTGRNGVYYINNPYLSLPPFQAYCQADANGGAAWTVIQRRQDGSVSFNRTWYDYKHGFGDPNGEYWLGLEKVYAMTSKEKYELWIELGDHEGERRHANYAAFEIGDEKESYYLKALWNYTGDAGDDFENSMDYIKNFTTFDRDNDAFLYANCAQLYKSAWWYYACGNSGLNGEYTNTNNMQGINWKAWHGPEYSLKYSHMAIRPVK